MPALTLSEIMKGIQGKSLKLENNSCAVCLCDMKDDEICRKTLCNHVFHKDCIDPWMNKHKNCPLCRHNLEKDDFLEHEKLLKN